MLSLRWYVLRCCCKFMCILSGGQLALWVVRCQNFLCNYCFFVVYGVECIPRLPFKDVYGRVFSHSYPRVFLSLCVFIVANNYLLAPFCCVSVCFLRLRKACHGGVSCFLVPPPHFLVPPLGSFNLSYL